MERVINNITSSELRAIEGLIVRNFAQQHSCPVIPDGQEGKASLVVTNTTGGPRLTVNAAVYFPANFSLKQATEASKRIDSCLLKKQDWV